MISIIFYNNIGNINLSKPRLDLLIPLIEAFDISNVDYELYLFGSYAKRNLTDSSDIDLLVLLPDSINKSRKLFVDTSNHIEDVLCKVLDFDLIFYNKSRFYEICDNIPLSFEGKVSNYMIKVKEVKDFGLF